MPVSFRVELVEKDISVCQMASEAGVVFALIRAVKVQAK
jgi:hypothetical protein